jgi:alpha-N-arabinofuranosidase
MKKVALAFLISLSAFLVNAQTTFKNPIISGMNPDPSICRVGDDFYLVTSTFEYFPGLPIYHSKDLVNWKMIGYALSRASNCPLTGAGSSGGNYAPSIRYHDSTFYITCTNYGGQGSQGAFYVTAKNPAGRWSDPHWVNNWAVDPSLLFANDSIYYVLPTDNGTFSLAVLNPVTGKFYKDPKIIANGTGSSSPEGPHLYKINDYYYLMSAEGGTGYQHMEVIQRSKSPWGPYTVSHINPVISNKNDPNNQFQAIGHADLVQLQDSSWWLVCLGIRPKGGHYCNLGRETFLAPVTWNADGWPKGGTNGVMNDKYPLPNLPVHIWGKDSVRDNFDSATLNLNWNFLRNPYAADWSLTEKPGYLRLEGSKISLKDVNSPAFIARRQKAFNMVVSTKISFTPTANSEEAGLAVRGNDNNHFDLVITKLAGKRVVMLRKYLQSTVTGMSFKEIADTGDIILRISATELQYKFWVEEGGHAATLIGTAATKDISTEIIGGFTGTFIGMYASGNGKSNVNSADFDWFDFEEEPSQPYNRSIGPKYTLNQMVAPEIISASSSSFNKVKIVWNNIANETNFMVERYTGDKFDSIGTTQANDTIFNDIGLSGKTMYIYRIKAKNSKGYSNPSIAVSVLTLPKPGPFFGTSSQIPGKIEAENYDYGIMNVAYYDSDTVNNGGSYRNDGVDIEPCSDTNGGFNIGWINNGEWLIYTVDVNDTIADIQLKVASNSGGSIKLELDGSEIAETDIPISGGWQTWETVTMNNIKLDTGQNKKLKVTFVNAGFNFNWMNFVKVNQTAVKVVEDGGISIYPNPALNKFTVKSEKFNYSNIKIFNLEGKCLFSKTINYQPENNIQFSLPVGMYILSLNNTDQIRNIKFSVIQ